MAGGMTAAWALGNPVPVPIALAGAALLFVAVRLSGDDDWKGALVMVVAIGLSLVGAFMGFFVTGLSLSCEYSSFIPEAVKGC